MTGFCERNINLAIVGLFLLALAELVVCAIQNTQPVHTGTCIGAIAGVIIPKE